MIDIVQNLLQQAERNLAENRLKDAKLALRKVLKKRPKSDRALYLLGLIAARAGKMKEAASWYRKALLQNEVMPEALTDLGSIRILEANYEDAIRLYRKALDVLPNSADVMSCLAGALISNQAFDEAEKLAREAIRLAPDLQTAHNNLGLILNHTQRVDEAITVFKHALTLNPNDLSTLKNLVNTLERHNDLDGCSKYLEHGLKLAPKDGRFNLLRAKLLHRQKKYDEAIHLLERLKNSEKSASLKRRFLFELGILHDIQQSHKQAYEYFKEGNEIVKTLVPNWQSRATAYLNDVQTLKTYFKADRLSHWSENRAGDRGLAGRPLPVFEVGFPRSGTTLLGKIMDAHPRCQTMDETETLQGVIDYIEALPEGYPDALDTVTSEQIVEMREIYFQGAAEYIDFKNCDVMVDKLPLALVSVGLIHRIFPSAKIVLALRHPFDCILSSFMQDFQLNDAMANFLSIDDACNLYKTVFDLWNQYVEILPLNFGMFRYEDLVKDRETHLTRLMEFLELPWHDDLLQHTSKSKMATVTPSYRQVSQPIYTRAVARWKNYENLFKDHKNDLTPYIKQFGYSAD